MLALLPLLSVLVGAKYLIVEKITWEWLFVTDWYFCNLYRLLTQIEISFLVDPNSD